MKTYLFQSCGYCWVFQICWHIGCSAFTASSFRIWNSSTGIPSPPLAFFIVMLVHSDGWEDFLEKGKAFIFQSHSPGQLFVTLWTAACQASLSITNFWSLLKLTSVESVMPSNHLIFCRPLLLPPSIFPRIRVFSNESVLPISWPKYCSFTFNISLSNEYSGLIFLRIDWLDLLAVQETVKSLLQHHSSKAAILHPSTL